MGTKAAALATPPSGPPPSNPQSAPNLVGFDPKGCVPQQTLYLQRNDILAFLLYSNITSQNVQINYRWLTPDGEIKEGQLQTGPFNLHGFYTLVLYEGWLLSFGLQQVNNPGAGAWCFAQAQIYRGTTAVANQYPDAIIWQGFVPYVTSNGWPGTPSKEITDGAGTMRSITGSTPAAGADISEVVPAQRRWTLLNFRAVLTTSAAVATRQVSASPDDGTNPFFTIRSSTTQAASLVYSYCLTPGSPFFYDGATGIIIPLSNLSIFKAGWRIRTNTVNIQAGDQWTAPQYTVLEWGQWDS
jgi:hypothetical protein